MQAPRPDNRNARLLLDSLLLAALFLRLIDLPHYAYNAHEMQFILIAQGPTLADVWRRSLIELHPPLLHFLRHFLLMITPDVFVQRLFSVVAGMASVFGLYRLGKDLRGDALGVFCAFAMGFTMIAVSTSLLVRDYAFFMVFLLGAYFFFWRFQAGRKTCDLAGFTALIFLACALNFSGFLLAAACGLSEGWRLLREKNVKTLVIYCASFLPLALLALFLYINFMAPGTAGPMWDRLAIVNGQAAPDFWGRICDTLLEIYLLFVPFGGMRGLPTSGIAGQLTVFLMMFGSVGLIALQALGLKRMRAQDHRLFCFIAVLWAVAVAASLVGFYPFSASRRCFFLLPFVILAYGYALEPFVQRILSSASLTRRVAIASLVVAFGLGCSGIYPRFADELTLRQDNLAAGQDYLDRHLHPGDAIVTGKIAAYFYLLEAKDQGKTAYNSYADVPYFHDTTVLAPFDPPFKPHADWQPFRDDLKTRLAEHLVPHGGKFWFVMYGWKSLEIWRLEQCPKFQPFIADRFSLDGVLIFGVRETDMAALLDDEAGWKACFAGYTPSAVGVPFPQEPPQTTR